MPFSYLFLMCLHFPKNNYSTKFSFLFGVKTMEILCSRGLREGRQTPRNSRGIKEEES